MMLNALLCAVVLTASPDAGTATTPQSPSTGNKWTKLALAGKPLWATIKTGHGDIVVRLFTKESPKTVANFVGLATGEKEWTHPATGEVSTARLYDGTIFHRVIPEFMIQGGDPAGNGTGGPGYRFEDERNALTFNKPGILAMANSGPNSNGSQFFITTSRENFPEHLNGKHTIFGEVIAGYEVAIAISQVRTGRQNRPSDPVTIESVQITDKRPPMVKVDLPKLQKRPADAPTARPADAPVQ
jgi:peptidyl-prolyl cis-trans isomerase A (cyclophilin A)